jgi:hypothetical protein
MKALTYIVLGDKRYEPGDSITRTDLKNAGQTEEQIRELVDGGALGEESDELHPDHMPIEVPQMITANDGGSGGE